MVGGRLFRFTVDATSRLLLRKIAKDIGLSTEQLLKGNQGE